MVRSTYTSKLRPASLRPTSSTSTSPRDESPPQRKRIRLPDEPPSPTTTPSPRKDIASPTVTTTTSLLDDGSQVPPVTATGSSQPTHNPIDPSRVLRKPDIQCPVSHLTSHVLPDTAEVDSIIPLNTYILYNTWLPPLPLAPLTRKSPAPETGVLRDPQPFNILNKNRMQLLRKEHTWTNNYGSRKAFSRPSLPQQKPERQFTNTFILKCFPTKNIWKPDFPTSRLANALFLSTSPAHSYPTTPITNHNPTIGPFARMALRVRYSCASRNRLLCKALERETRAWKKKNRWSTRGRAEGGVYSYNSRFKNHGCGRNLPGVSGLRRECFVDVGLDLEEGSADGKDGDRDGDGDEDEGDCHSAFVPSIFGIVQGEMGPPRPAVEAEGFVPSSFEPAAKSDFEKGKEDCKLANKGFSDFLSSGMRKRKRE